MASIFFMAFFHSLCRAPRVRAAVLTVTKHGACQLGPAAEMAEFRR
jgi:hypothetical protein